LIQFISWKWLSIHPEAPGQLQGSRAPGHQVSSRISRAPGHQGTRAPGQLQDLQGSRAPGQLQDLQGSRSAPGLCIENL